MKKENFALGLAVVAIVIAIIGWSLPKMAPTGFSGVTNYDTVETAQLNVGSGCDNDFSDCTGSATTLIKEGTCNLVSDNSIAATSTGIGTCAISGLLAGDRVVFNIATTSTAMSRNIVPIGYIAAADSLTIRLFNLTGAASTPGDVPGFGSSTPYQVFR